MIKVFIALFILGIILCNLLSFILLKIKKYNKGRYSLSNKYKSLIVITTVLVGSILINSLQISSVYDKTSTKIESYKNKSLQTILENTDEVILEKKIFSLRKHFYVLVDDILVGEIKGRVFSLTGDVLELRDMNNNFIKKESQIKRFGVTHEKLFNVSFDRLAEIEDSTGTIGYIGEEKLKDFFKFNHTQYFYDKNSNKIGSAKPDFFMLSKDYKVLDNEDNIDYVIDGSFFSLFNNYTINVFDNSNIDLTDAMFYTIIEDSIIDSKFDVSSSSNSKKSK